MSAEQNGAGGNDKSESVAGQTSRPGREREGRSKWTTVGIGAVVVGILATIWWLSSTEEPVEGPSTTVATTTAITTSTLADSTAPTSGPTSSVATSLVPETTVTSAATTTSTEASQTSATTGTADPAAYESAVWPWFTSELRFDDPVAAARSFATEVGQFVDPVVGEFLQGDSRSGEVEVRPRENGPVTTVFVRMLGSDNTWWVLGSATANIEVTQPSALETIGDSMVLTGRANAFEGTVNVSVLVDGSLEPVLQDFVTGRMGEMGPFSASMSFTQPDSGSGVLLLKTVNAEDGSTWELGAIRIKF